MFHRFMALAICVCALPDSGAAETRQPWEPGVEKPCDEALKSVLYIHPRPAAEQASLKFTVTEQAGADRGRAPVRGSIPFHRGELTDPKHIRLLDAAGNEIPVQGLVTSLWPEGTVRWLCLDFVLDVKAGEAQTLTLEYGSKVRTARSSGLKVLQNNTQIQIDTGKISVSFSPGQKFSGPVVRADGGTRGDINGVLSLSKGDEGAEPLSLPLRIDEIKLIENGPVQATVYLKGGYGDEKTIAAPESKDLVYKFPFHGHVRIYGDTARMEVIHSFGYNGDENRDFVRRYGLVLPVKTAQETAFIYGGESGKRSEAPLARQLTLTQGRHNWWRLSGDSEAQGKRFGGWAALKNPSGFTTAVLRNAWQQWPVTFEAASNGDLALYIYGAPEKEFLDLRYEGQHFGKSKSMYVGPKLSNTYFVGTNGKAGGILKISELVLDFEADPQNVAAGSSFPLVPFAGSQRIAETKALGHIGTYDGAKAAGYDTDGLKRYANALLDFPIIQHEANGFYGWVDWPDQGDCNPPKDGKFDMIMQGGIGWTNSCRALPAYYYHYAAGGHEKYLHLGHAYAVHTIGIDLEHPGGEMDFGTPHRHNQVHWRDGGEPRQCGVRGWIADFWMTGHPEIRRILFDVYLPHCTNDQFVPKAGPGPDKVWVYKKQASLQYPHLMAYLTDNNPVWIKHHKALDEAVYEVVSRGLCYNDNKPWGEGHMIWENGRIKIAFEKCPKGQMDGYFLTYGGDDRLVEHFSLFGYEISFKALKVWGDSYWANGKKPPPGTTHASSYHNLEGGAAGYYRLTGNQAALESLRKTITARKISGESLQWDAYTVKGTAQEWHALTQNCDQYDKNGFKMAAPRVYENIVALPAFESAQTSKANISYPKTGQKSR